MHIIVWKYKVKEENRVEFEFEYGKLGTWSKLFNTSENYKGSTLHRNSDIYLLVDTWLDKQSYESFINLNSKEYDFMSSKFEELYESEQEIGRFDTV